MSFAPAFGLKIMRAGVLRKDVVHRMLEDPSSRAPKASPVGSHAHFHVGPAWRGRSGQVKVLRAVASLELTKGMVVLAAGCSILLFLHKDTYEIAWNLLQILHISPDHHFAHIFLRWADTLTDRKLWAVSGVAVAYSLTAFCGSLRPMESPRLGRMDCPHLRNAVLAH